MKGEILNYDDKKLRLINDLKHNIYSDPKITDEDILMAIDWCEHRNVDVKLNMVAITKRNAKDKKTGRWEEKTVLMPTISYYRLKAHATGAYLSKSAPAFGPFVTRKVGSKEVTYPEWCEITIEKLVQGQIGKFTDRQYWLSNYASITKDDPSPNYIWAKREPEQLAKCTEASALRMAFTELFGQDYTFEELDGKIIDGDFHDVKKTQFIDKETGEIFNNNLILDSQPQQEEIVKDLKELFKEYPERVSTWLQKAKATSVEDFPIPAAKSLLEKARAVKKAS